MEFYQNLTVLAAFLFLYSVIASRLERTPINGALVYMVFGVLCGPLVLGVIDTAAGGETLAILAELTLALVLFTDSANADLTVVLSIVGHGVTANPLASLYGAKARERGGAI